jgi:c-di-GMP-binding flagellar brake protein YcgR
MKPLGDRRTRVRFEVVGSFWGTVDVGEPARLVNISRTGALVASRSAVAADSTQTLRLTLQGHELPVDTKVRYLRHVPPAEGKPEHYLIGLEFVSVPPSLLETIEQIVNRSASS